MFPPLLSRKAGFLPTTADTTPGHGTPSHFDSPLAPGKAALRNPLNLAYILINKGKVWYAHEQMGRPDITEIEPASPGMSHAHT
jgi:hypothetical protein